MKEVININDQYKKLLDETLRAGLLRQSRGLRYLEHPDSPVIIMIDPLNSLVRLRARKLNYAFNHIEKLSYISGVGFYPHVITAYNNNYGNFVEVTGTDPGSYGYRVVQQLPRIYHLIKRDHETRQAVINIYNYHQDVLASPDNVPCTLGLNFRTRGDHLDLVTYMRSNDLFWGFPYDVSQFTFIQSVVARWLKLKLGVYAHVVTSLHLYDTHVSEAVNIVSSTAIVDVAYQPMWDVDYEDTWRCLRHFWKQEEKIRVAESEEITNTDSGCLNQVLMDLIKYWRKKREKRR